MFEFANYFTERQCLYALDDGCNVILFEESSIAALKLALSFIGCPGNGFLVSNFTKIRPEESMGRKMPLSGRFVHSHSLCGMHVRNRCFWTDNLSVPNSDTDAFQDSESHAYDSTPCSVLYTLVIARCIKALPRHCMLHSIILVQRFVLIWWCIKL